MINPRSLVRALDKHWEIIEYLVALGREHIAFERDEVLSLLAKAYPDSSREQGIERLQQLINSELLVRLSHSDSLQINDVVSQFVSSLLHEHELGLPEILKVRINDIQNGLAQMQQAMDERDMAALQSGAIRIDKQLREILQALERDSHAIQAIAERAKSSNESMPLAQRYREVLEAYDHYVLPMEALMDSGAGGTFYPLLERAESVLDKLVQTLTTQGGLYSHQQMLRQVGFRVKDIRQQGRLALKQATNTLMPLREEVRRHNHLSAAIGQLLGEVRKKGLNRSFPSQCVPVWRKQRSLSIAVGPELLTLMEQARGYQAKTVSFPEQSYEPLLVTLEQVDEDAIQRHLYQSLPVPDLMDWLLQYYADYQDTTLLKLYHKLIRLPDINATPNPNPVQHTLKQVRLKLHSHIMESE
ncbi:hypothetical protein [methane-oxidizing endosymbiont of Gigantopelta aegis]|uniref:hypothetical protein n=1 Tax=methane-oxidizing endosymbiont of Gigantopelta aegis TaxID=2794938 RepID=UPI0018DC9499|nr:hypothetical protein [methane-oxidizing endosymbiont of Gigantopelta aegis]